MKLSKRWLLDFVDPQTSDKNFVDEMTLSGSKVEGFAVEGSELENIVVGRVASIEPHPDSNHMFVCLLDVGETDLVQVVTGAQNVKAGDFVPVAKNHSVVAGGKTIKAGKLRGVMSNGMLCSLSELGLTQHDFPYAIEDGIFILGDDVQLELGLNIREAIGLHDVVTEFEITPNRPDCLSVIGLAREAAATFGASFVAPVPPEPKGDGNVADLLSVKIFAPELCYRYAGAVVQNVRVKPSPRWLRERLRASGVRPINNIVDITNYVMFEYGQPMHAFDLRYVDEGKIIVRKAEPGEKITTLDGATRTLTPDMLVIADANKPIAVAGVMGGEYSGVYDETTTIVFESACFNGMRTRSTAQKLGLRTEASARYEKELDPDSCLRCLHRALELVQLLDAGDVAGGVCDVFPTPKTVRKISFRPNRVNSFLGIDCPAEEQTAILERLGFLVVDGVVTVPSWRGDVEAEADLAEEIARFYGYNNIPSTPLRGKADGVFTDKQTFERTVRDTLLALGCDEICTYSFISPKEYDKIALPADDVLRNSVIISNPLGEDTSVMRTTALPSLLSTLARNYNNRNERAALFELATIYSPKGENLLPDEPQEIAIALYGADADFFALKGIVEALLTKAGIPDADYTPESDNLSFHPGRTAAVHTANTRLGILGEIAPVVLHAYDVDTRAYAAVLNFDALFANRSTDKQYKPMPRFPAVTRDLALVCNRETPVNVLQSAIRQGAGDLLEELKLFDVYTGSQIAPEKKSVAFSLVLRSAKGTLTDEQSDAAIKRCLKALLSVGAALRT
jgi:phenylalanyl-tRNA synthetase beta chain